MKFLAAARPKIFLSPRIMEELVGAEIELKLLPASAAALLPLVDTGKSEISGTTTS